MNTHHRHRTPRPFTAAAAGLAGALLGAGLLEAATATSSFTASVTVLNECSIGTTPLALGQYDPIVANRTNPKDATGTVTITCTKGASPKIALGVGNHANGSQRRMKDSGTNYLQYEIYRDPALISMWGTGANELVAGAAPNYNARTFTAYGRIGPGQDVPAGSYSDVVVATVEF